MSGAGGGAAPNPVESVSVGMVVDSVDTSPTCSNSPLHDILSVGIIHASRGRNPSKGRPMETTRKDLMQALREAGETLVREQHEATGGVPTHLADEVTLQGDIDHLDDVARDHGLEGGMPDGYSRPLADEWHAVFEGTREALDALDSDG